MKYIVCALSVLLLASCSNDWATGLADRPATADRSAPATLGDASQGRVFDHHGARAFASAPDRGSLVQYPQTPVVRRSGAYTFHAADLSEEHALRATVTGDLSFAAPDGTQTRLAYERHVEHPDGNWSWIGRAAGDQGESTVITFGEAAVFGTIPQGGDKPDLRLTVADGRAWVVTADPRLLRGIRNEATHPTKPDYLIPGDLATAVGASAVETDVASTSTESGTITAAATVDGNTIVDVLVGFTDGFSTFRGGDSAAITRVHNLVDISNQVFVNSQVAVRARLVHSMKVAYPDATANKTALEEMTGFQAPSTKTTPAPAFSALRLARDQFGADLVVLVRRFQEPENGGCGIAWLIGGGLSGIDSSDQYFGYSVVSDGQDAGTDGKTYFCREETFSHELGHNMGSQHDSENATKDDGSQSYGAYSYSFGYKTSATAGDFHTVMAYGDKGQTRNRVFSNPNVSICGINANLVCGVVDRADNARSLGQTAPTVAKFRAAVVAGIELPLRNDVDGDGMSDLLWHSPLYGRFAYWLMQGSDMRLASASINVADYKLAATGDLNGDGLVDLVWANRYKVWLWRGTGNGFVAEPLGDLPSGWRVVATGDVDGDGKSDLLWHNASLGRFVYWLMDGSVVRAKSASSDVRDYRLAATGDFNGDGLVDLIWSNDSKVWLWLGTDAGFLARSVGDRPTGWQIVGAGDLDGDGNSDLLWHNSRYGRFAYWLMDNETARFKSASIYVADYSLSTAGDFSGDGFADLVWSNNTNIWLWSGTASNGFLAQKIGASPSEWVIQQ